MCDCDLYDRPELFERRTIKGRKEHRCCECLETIAKGEEHEYAKGLWDGRWDDYRTCSVCVAMMREVEIQCYPFTQLMDYLDERDHPGVESVAGFHARRWANWERLNDAKRQEAPA